MRGPISLYMKPGISSTPPLLRSHRPARSSSTVSLQVLSRTKRPGTGTPLFTDWSEVAGFWCSEFIVEPMVLKKVFSVSEMSRSVQTVPIGRLARILQYETVRHFMRVQKRRTGFPKGTESKRFGVQTARSCVKFRAFRGLFSETLA